MASLKIQCNMDNEARADIKIRMKKIDITEDHILLGVLSLGGVWVHG